MKRFLFLITFLVALQSCKEAEEELVDPRVIFTFVRGNNHSSDEDLWIILRDDTNGELLEMRQINYGTTQRFISQKPLKNNKISVTYLRSYMGLHRSTGVNTYRSVDIGSEWAMDLPNKYPQGSSDIRGNYTLTINDSPQVKSVAVSNKFGSVGGDYGFVSANPWSGEVYVDKSDTSHLVYMGTALESKYTWIKNVDTFEDVTLSYNDFKSFDKTVHLEFPSSTRVYSSVTAITTPTFYPYGFELSQLQAWGPNTQLNIGYLNQFSYYYTYVSVEDFTFVSRGAAPSSITYVPSDGYSVVSNDDINKYSITTTKDYVYSVTAYGYSDSSVDQASFSYYAPNDIKAHFEVLPPELIEKYSIDKIPVKYSYTNFIVKGRPYSEMIKSGFDADYDQMKPSEESGVTVR